MFPLEYMCPCKIGFFTYIIFTAFIKYLLGFRILNATYSMSPILEFEKITPFQN